MGWKKSIYVSEELNLRLREQAKYQPSMPTDLVQLVQTEFNERFWKIFTSSLPVRWPVLEKLMRTLTTSHFLPEIIVMPRGFKEQTRMVKEHPWKIPLTEQQ